MGKCTKIKTLEAFWQEAEAVTEGFLFAMLTDDVVCVRWPFSLEEKEKFREKEKKLLDIRIFNEKKELRMFRGNIGREFFGRMLEDEGSDIDVAKCFDEEQYLNIDDVKVKIRNYLGYYEETGQAYVKDWRLVKFFQEKG